MAIYVPGPMGSFTGKIGNIVITKWKKKLVGRSAPGKLTKSLTNVQVAHRSKFGLVSQILTDISSAIKIGYQSANPKYTPMNAALRYHFNRIVTGAAPDYQIDYKQLKLTLPFSNNEIGEGLNVSVVMEEANNAKIRWAQSPYPNYLTMYSDLVYILFYNPEKQQSFFVQKAARRDALEVAIKLPSGFSQHQIYGYLFFVSANGKLVSATHYLGEWIIT